MTAPATARTVAWAPRKGGTATTFPCGHPRADANSRGDCRTCKRLARQRARARAPRRDHILTRSRIVAASPRTVRPPIALRPATLALVEACRAEYQEAVGQLELFTALPEVAS